MKKIFLLLAALSLVILSCTTSGGSNANTVALEIDAPVYGTLIVSSDSLPEDIIVTAANAETIVLEKGSIVSVTPQSSLGEFAEWTGDLTGTAAKPSLITMEKDLHIGAAFTPLFTEGKITGRMSIEHGGLTREFMMYAPNGFDPAQKHPIMMILHGFNQPIEYMHLSYTTMSDKADQDGTIIIYPKATGESRERNLAWNTTFYGNTQKELGLENVDDVDYLSTLFDVLISELNGDSERLYVHGVSMGGAMTATLSCHLQDRLAAIAPMIMTMGWNLIDEFPNAKPIPIMTLTGTEDPVVSSEGTPEEMKKDMSVGLSVVSYERNIEYWKKRNGQSGDGEMTLIPDVNTEIFMGEEHNSYVEKYSWTDPSGTELYWFNVVNGGHWKPTLSEEVFDPVNFNGMDLSRNGNCNQDFDAAGAIYDFFMSHTLSE